MEELNLMSPYDELSELRSVMTVQEIAEVTGLRRETFLRARPDSRFKRRTQQALDDLYAVVARLRPTLGSETVHLAAVIRRPQPALARRSIADLLQDGEIEEVLAYLRPPAPSERERLESIELDPGLMAGWPRSPRDDDPRVQAKLAEEDRRVVALLDSDPELASVLPRVEEAIHELFGADARIGRTVVVDRDDPGARDQLHLRIRAELPFDEQIDRLGRFLVGSESLLEQVHGRLTVGNL